MMTNVTACLILLFQLKSINCYLFPTKKLLLPGQGLSGWINPTRNQHFIRRNDLLRFQGFKQYGDDIDPTYCSLTHNDIMDLIVRRTKARRARNFKLADEILKTLHQNNVFLHDEKKLWRADGDTFDIKGYQGMEYKKSSQSRPISSREEEYVNQKLRERSRAKLDRDFDTADDILDELRFIKNVVVDDDSLTWKVTEPIKTEYTYGGRRLNNVPNEELQKIEQLIKERSEAKSRKDFEVSDDILDELKVIHGVRVDDSKKAWFFLPRYDDEMKESHHGDQAWERNEHKMKGKQYGSSQSRSKATSGSKAKDGQIRIPDGISLSFSNEINISKIKNASNSCVQDVDEEYVGNSSRMFDSTKKYEDQGSSSSSLTTQNDDELDKCTVTILKEKLRNAGLPVSGKKAELIERLRNNL